MHVTVCVHNLLDYDAACVHTMSAWMLMISIKYPGTEIPLGTWLMARAQNTPRMGTCQWGMRAPRARTPPKPTPAPQLKGRRASYPHAGAEWARPEGLH